MIAEIFRFELRQQLRSPLLWLISALFGLMAFGAASSDAVTVGSAIGNVYRNAPTVIVTFLGIFTVLGLFVVVSFISGALLRDFEIGTAELFFASPMRKRDFLIGRFSAALVACLLVFLVVALGLMVAQFMPWIDAQRLGPFSLKPYLWGFAVLVLPNLLFIGALMALLAVTTRSLLVVYLGVLAFFVLWQIAGSLTQDLDNLWLATLMDPFGIRALNRMVRYWSIEERNTQLPSIAGYLWANRALWTSVAMLMLASAFALFKTEASGTRKSWFKRRRSSAPMLSSAIRSGALTRPVVAAHFDASTTRAQLLQQFRFDTLGVLTSVPFLIMLAFAVLNLVGSSSAFQSLFGTKVYPTTSLMLQAIDGSYNFMLVLIVMFYAGELVWKERAAKLGEVSDAMPIPDWVPLLAKFITLIVIVLIVQGIGGLTAIGIQLSKHYYVIEPLLYVKSLLLGSIPFVLMGGLALVLQVYSNNKFIGFGALIAILVLQSVLALMHFEHNLYNYASAPAAPYSDMNGYGHFLFGRLWFQAYWAVLLIALLLLAKALWVRGVAPSGRDRMALLRHQLRGGTGIALAASLLAFVAIGSYIFWNTNIRNPYLASDQALDLQARYELEYAKYKGLAQPRVTSISSQVDLWPEHRSVRISGEYKIHNPHAQPITDFHIQLPREATVQALSFGAATLTRFDQPLGYRIYHLATAMQPGEQRVLAFDLDYAQHGFGNDTGQTQLVENGSFINSSLLPTFGYDQNGQIQDKNERRKRDLGAAPRMAKLEDQAARANTYLTDDADWIDFKTTVCTAPDQIALAPGYLQKEFSRNGRRCFDYAMNRPMLAFAAWLSARWQVRREQYQGIALEVYYDPKHAFNVDRMIAGSKRALDYFQTNFSPYQHQQLRILEFPAYNRFAQSFANTIPFSESIGFVADLRDADAIDYVFYVTAHEVAHQWWAHQVIGANVQGATMLSESLAQYSALMVMEKEYGRAKMRRFLKYELDRYLSDRGGELVEELALNRVENQPYIHYRKGSLVFYRLREEIGEVALNRALAKFLAAKAYQMPPYTTSAELIEFIRAEAAPEQQDLITDLFEKITFYDNRLLEAKASQRADGKYEISFKFSAAKRYADGLGKETAGKLDDNIEIGVFARADGASEANETVLLLEKRRITQAETTLKLIIDKAPYEVGIDPYNKLIDRVPDDNRRRVDVQ